MERRIALVIATVIAAAFVGGMAAVAADNGLVGGRNDGVGQLEPVTSSADPATTPTITKYLDPVTGELSDTPPARTPLPAAPSPAEPAVGTGGGTVTLRHDDGDDHDERNEGDDHGVEGRDGHDRDGDDD